MELLVSRKYLNRLKGQIRYLPPIDVSLLSKFSFTPSPIYSLPYPEPLQLERLWKVRRRSPVLKPTHVRPAPFSEIKIEFLALGVKFLPLLLNPV
jgi:hypothetical protein